MKLGFSPRFNGDLADVASYIAADNPQRAISFALEIRDRCRTLIVAPESGRARNDIKRGLRSIPFGRYVIFYTLRANEIRVERVLHGARDLRALFDE